CRTAVAFDSASRPSRLLFSPSATTRKRRAFDVCRADHGPTANRSRPLYRWFPKQAPNKVWRLFCGETAGEAGRKRFAFLRLKKVLTLRYRAGAPGRVPIGSFPPRADEGAAPQYNLPASPCLGRKNRESRYRPAYRRSKSKNLGKQSARQDSCRGEVYEHST